MNRKETGNNAEALACNFLEQRGLRLLHRNFHCRQGEIDLVMEHRDSLVFVEVRYRKYSAFGGAAASVTPEKCRRIVRCARYFLSRHHAREQPMRFDVIAIDGVQGALQIEWLKDAFRPGA